jgi:hypothetical protein
MHGGEGHPVATPGSLDTERNGQEDESVAWAVESVTNPMVLRIHSTVELTTRTIETFPPGEAPAPFDAIARLGEVRTVDLHRYRARLNLRPGADQDDALLLARDVFTGSWGRPVTLDNLPAQSPKAFTIRPLGERFVAESPEMAEPNRIAAALFAIEGVAEVIVGDGLALVGLGRLFRWSDLEPVVTGALVDVG